MDRLNENDTVTVTLPLSSQGRARRFLDCYVLAVAGRTAALEAVDKSETLRLPDRLENVLMTFRHGNALIGLKGTLVATDVFGEYRFCAHPREGGRRTRATRATVALPARLRVAGSESFEEGMTVNVSITGVLIESELEASPGEQLEIELHAGQHDEALLLRGLVVRTGGGAVAVEFGAFANATHGQIVKLVIDERRASRMRRSAVVAAERPDF
jgi:hypothetical protein